MRRFLIVLAAAAVLPYVVGLGDSSIWDANEAYYVETPREMIERGDYVNPSFNYEPRFNKPVLSYWIVAGLYRVFGVSVGVERVAIAAMAMLMLAGAFFIARAISPAVAGGFGGAASWLAVLGLAAGPRFFMFSRRILVDMAVSAMMTLVLLFFVLAERYPARRRLFLVLMYVAVGLGVLTKGPVAAVVPALVFLVYLAVHRELGRLREMMIPAGTLIALAIAAPWYVALYLEHGWTYIYEFFIAENIGRYTDTIGVQARSPFFYIPVVFTDSLPWSLALPFAVAAWWKQRDRLRTLLVLWIGVTVLFFSLSQTKQDLYIFPIVAAVAALGGDWVARERPGLRAMLGTLGVVLALLGAFVLYLFGGDSPYAIDGAVASGVIAAAGGAAIVGLAWRGAARASIVAMLMVLIAFNWILVLQALPSYEAYKPVVPLSEVIRREARPEDEIAHFDVAMPSMVFYLQRHIDIWLDAAPLGDQIRSNRKVFAVIPAHRYPQLKIEFGVPTCELARYPTGDIRLRTLLEDEPLPEVVLIANRCGP